MTTQDAAERVRVQTALVPMVCRQDNGAFEALMQTFRPWVRGVAAQWRSVPGLGVDDLEQAAWLGLVEAAQSFQAGHLPFSSFAMGVMRRRIMDIVRGAGRVKHQPLTHAEALLNEDGEEWRQLTGRRLLEDEVIDRANVADVLTTLRSALGPMERLVLGCVLDGMGPSEGASHLGLTYKAYDNALQRMRRKARSIWTINATAYGPKTLSKEA